MGLIRLAVIMLGDRAAAEDVVQDAFLGLYRRWEGLADGGNALTYVRSSVLNGCRNARRSRARRDRRDRDVIAAASLGQVCASAEAMALDADIDTGAGGAWRAAAGSASGTPLAWLGGAAHRCRTGDNRRRRAGDRQGHPERPRSPPLARPSASGVPAYYAAMAATGLVIGDTITGARLATLPPPRGTSFVGVTAAADDRTFVVSTVPVGYDGGSPPRSAAASGATGT